MNKISQFSIMLFMILLFLSQPTVATPHTIPARNPQEVEQKYTECIKNCPAGKLQHHCMIDCQLKKCLNDCSSGRYRSFCTQNCYHAIR